MPLGKAVALPVSFHYRCPAMGNHRSNEGDGILPSESLEDNSDTAVGAAPRVRRLQTTLGHLGLHKIRLNIYIY